MNIGATMCFREVGTPCYGVPARASAGGMVTPTTLFTPYVAPLKAARTAQRAIPTN